MIPGDSTVPTMEVDTAAVMADANALRDASRKMRGHVDGLVATWSTLQPVFVIDGTDAIYSKLDPTVDVIDGYVIAFDLAADALEAFAVTVAELQRQRDDLLIDLVGARILERNAEDNPHDPTLAVSDADTDALINRAEGLRRSFEQAEEDCAASLDGIGLGTGDGLPARAGVSQFFWGSAPLWQSQAAAFSSTLTDGALRTMSYLATLSTADADAWLKDHPRFAETVAAVPPPPTAVAQWWNSMGPGEADESGNLSESAQQVALITAIPGVIGNLGGVRFSSRNNANRAALVVEETRLADIQSQFLAFAEPDSRDAETFLSEQGFDSLSQLRESIAAVDSTKAALEGPPTAPRSLIQYTPTVPPLAAVAVGDMDSASQVTVNTPGMNSTVAKSMEEWTAAAENLYQEQGRRLNAAPPGADSETSTAVVAWIGYHAPQTATAPTVLGSELAQRGADDLVKFLEATAATRGTPRGQDISTLAHSYGAVVATLALSRTPVENLTMLAPAGVDLSIPHVSDLKVVPDNVWTTEAKADFIANVGRGDVEIPFANPIDIHSEHPVNPGAAGYGANIYSSEGAVLDSTSYHATGGHDVALRESTLLENKPIDDPDNPVSYGYLDDGSTSLRNAALTTLGYGDDVEKEEPESWKLSIPSQDDINVWTRQWLR